MVRELEVENRKLEQLVPLFQDNELVTFVGGRYTDDIREFVMELLSLDVSMNKVNDVIKVALKKLANIEVDRIPSTGIKDKLLQEALILAQLKVADAMLDNECTAAGNCLHGDGISKFHRHYQNFEVTTSSGKTLSCVMFWVILVK